VLTEAPAPLTSLSETVERLRSDLENIQRELDQALEVWRSTLITEKKEFQAQLQNQQQTWNADDRQWQRQREAYEQKIQDLQKTFDDQIALTEQNALRALNELDDSWQRDKLHWQQESSRRIKELELLETHGAAERQKQESALQELRDQVMQLEAQAENRDRDFSKSQEGWEQAHDLQSVRIREQDLTIQELRNHVADADSRKQVQEADWNNKQDAWNQLRASYEERIRELETSLSAATQPPTLDVAVIEELKATWDREKSVWQQSLYDNIRQMNERELQWNEEREKQDRFLRKLQDEVVELQGLLAGAETRKTISESFIDTYMRSLESEVSVLDEMIAHLFTPQPKSALIGHPMRRKTDLPYAFR